MLLGGYVSNAVTIWSGTYSLSYSIGGAGSITQYTQDVSHSYFPFVLHCKIIRDSGRGKPSTTDTMMVSIFGLFKFDLVV